MAWMRRYSNKLWILITINLSSIHFFDQVNPWLGGHWQRQFKALFLN